MEDASLNKDGKIRNFGKHRDVDSEDFNSELSVAVPHGDSEDSLVVFLSDGQLLVGSCEKHPEVTSGHTRGEIKKLRF